MCLRVVKETYSETIRVWFEDIIVVLIVSSLWCWLILVLSRGVGPCEDSEDDDSL